MGRTNSSNFKAEYLKYMLLIKRQKIANKSKGILNSNKKFPLQRNSETTFYSFCGAGFPLLDK